ncbi:TNT domain-containing protein [Streptomyces chromofuscus]|uniref:TNT domain-containing protein n=1 Tax=Streptomyces chromofuscus TaxID=42881 RepID=A0A7M2T0T7_STRCW|nr:TNT domain-containing protein [Streptomyces chromofuscus]QOV41779.1 TNT domain-containing protein [Streptomyces chromofuscus]
MRVPRRIAGSAVLLLLLVGISPATAQAAAAETRNGVTCPTQHRDTATTKAPSPQLEAYYGNDWRLGPKVLPRTGPIGRMLQGYRPEGPTSGYWFLGCYWQTNPQNDPQVGGWWFPDHNGFVLRNGRPVKRSLTLRKGQLIDLFGRGDAGHFLAPKGTPFAKRAIPPSNLDEYNASDPPFNYHLYEVTEDFTVEAGPARPWFNQPGLGTQYYTSTIVGDLKSQGKLKEITGT